MRSIHVHGASDGRDIYINPQYIESFAVHDGQVKISTVGISDACFTVKESLTEIVEMLYGEATNDEVS